MKERKVNINNIFYGVVGVATLMVAVMGATFAYFTATANNATVIKGNMATIDFDLSVAKVTDADDEKGGLIPMSNNMMEQAISNASTKGVCIDDNGNAVCQIYKITINNTSSASMFVDGYVTLRDGSGTPTDLPTGFTYIKGTETTMRWAQAFCTTEANGLVSGCSTASGANSTLRSDSNPISFTALGGAGTKADGKNTGEMRFTYDDNKDTSVKGSTIINGNTYEVINTNYIRLSGRTKGDTAYKKDTDVSSALVYNQYLSANDNDATNNTGTSSSKFTDSQVYYIVAWLSENGEDQTSKNDGGPATNPANVRFFEGNVTFITAQGSEVTATFTGLKKVDPTA